MSLRLKLFLLVLATLLMVPACRQLGEILDQIPVPPSPPTSPSPTPTASPTPTPSITPTRTPVTPTPTATPTNTPTSSGSLPLSITANYNGTDAERIHYDLKAVLNIPSSAKLKVRHYAPWRNNANVAPTDAMQIFVEYCNLQTFKTSPISGIPTKQQYKTTYSALINSDEDFTLDSNLMMMDSTQYVADGVGVAAGVRFKNPVFVPLSFGNDVFEEFNSLNLNPASLTSFSALFKLLIITAKTSSSEFTLILVCSFAILPLPTCFNNSSNKTKEIEENKKLSENKTKINEDYLKDAFEANKKELELQLANIDIKLNNEDLYYSDRLSALDKDFLKRNEIAKLDYDEEFRLSKGSQDKQKTALLNFQLEKLKLIESYNKQKNTLEALDLDPITQLATSKSQDKDPFKSVIDSGKKVEKEIENVGKKSEDTKKRILELGIATSEWLGSFSSEFLQNSGMGSLETFFDGSFDKLLAGADTTEEKFAVTFNAIAESAQEAFNLIFSFIQPVVNSISKSNTIAFQIVINPLPLSFTL